MSMKNKQFIAYHMQSHGPKARAAGVAQLGWWGLLSSAASSWLLEPVFGTPEISSKALPLHRLPSACRPVQA